MSESIASSTSFGSRPRRSRMSSYSLSVSPSARWRGSASAAMSGGDVLALTPADGLGDRREELQPVDRAAERIDRVLGVRHQAEDVARRAAHPGDVVDRAVRVVPRRIPQHDLPARVELGELLGRDVEATRTVLGRDRQSLTGGAGGGERRAGVDDLELDLAEDE